MLINETIDGCYDHTHPGAIVTSKLIFQQLNGHAKRGIRLRYITDINPDNILYCKEMIKNGHQLRHIRVSNIKTFVKSQQYFFDTLWSAYAHVSEVIR